MAASQQLRNAIKNVIFLSAGVAVGVLGDTTYHRFLAGHLKLENNKSSLTLSGKLRDFSEQYGLPRSSDILSYKNHLVSYDKARRIPSWVIEHLTKELLGGDADRAHSHFKADWRIAKHHSASNEDYLKSGYSRGHMVPAADNCRDQEAMDDTFILSNIVPQDPENNTGYWYRMEHFCRELTKKYTDIYVISGPLFLPYNEPREDKKHVKYEVIGKGRVAVPTHLFKVILAENYGTPIAVGCFVVPNKPIPPQTHLKKYQITLQQLQSDSGLTLFDDNIISGLPQLCAIDSCNLIKQDVVDFRNFYKKLKKAKNLEELDLIWSKGKADSNVKIDTKIAELYRARRKDLSNSL